MYANDYDGYYPGDHRIYSRGDNNGSCCPYAWYWDNAATTSQGGIPIVDTLLKYGMKRNITYCPSWPEWNTDNHYSGSYLCETGYFLFTFNNKLAVSLRPTRVSKAVAGTVLMSDELIWDPTPGSWFYVNHGTNGHNSEPVGGNILYADGHVMWKALSDYDQSTYLNPAYDWEIYAW